MTFLTNLSWRNKIFLGAGLGLACMVIGFAVCGYAIWHLTRTIGETEQAMRFRLAAAMNARMSVLDVDRNQTRVIAMNEPDQVRSAAIASIKGASLLDDNLQQLQTVFGDHPQVRELLKLAEDIKAPRMEVLTAAKRNDDGMALTKAASFNDKLEKIDELSSKILADEQAKLYEQFARDGELGKKVGKSVLILGIVLVVLGIAASFAFGQALTKPLHQMVAALTSLAKGNLRNAATGYSGRDEVGEAWSALSETVVGLNRMVCDVRDDAKTLSSHADNLSGLANTISHTKIALGSATEKIDAESEEMTNLSNRSVERLDQVNNIESKTRDAVRANVVATNAAVSSFRQVENEMNRTLDTARELARSTQKITAISAQIAEIAEQTNLLALNAAIEAARAGEQGRGFAVVADEVRKLADRSSQATAEIGGIAATISTKVEQAVSALVSSNGEIAASLVRFDEIASATSITESNLSQMRNALIEVAANLQAERTGASRITNTVSELVDLAQNTAQQADQLGTAAGSINMTSRRLTTAVDRFTL